MLIVVRVSIPVLELLEGNRVAKVGKLDTSSSKVRNVFLQIYSDDRLSGCVLVSSFAVDLCLQGYLLELIVVAMEMSETTKRKNESRDSDEYRGNTYSSIMASNSSGVSGASLPSIFSEKNSSFFASTFA